MHAEYDLKLKKDSVILAPGEYYVSKGDIAISTLLGSCISVCLRDEENRVSGMNHFLLSTNADGVNKADFGRYGIHAMELIINTMLKLGAKKQNLKAKAFGGANIIKVQDKHHFSVADSNCLFIKNFLLKEKIPLVSSALGGNSGRIVHYVLKDFSVYVKETGASESTKVVQQDKIFIDSLEKEDSSSDDITLFD